MAEGWAVGKPGSGTRVRPRPAAPAAKAPRAQVAGPEIAFDLRPGRTDPALFPHEAWRRAVAVAAATAPTGDHGDPAGLPEVRRVLADWIGRSRRVQTTPDRLVVTAGAQQAFDLVARVLVGPGTVVAVEDPGYPPLRDLLRAHGARLARVPVDADGIVLPAIPRTARLVCVTPTHQFPTGAAMAWERRRRLLALAERHDAYVLEDDHVGEIRHGARPLEPLHALDPAGRVLYAGTFSTILDPSLRLGLLVVPPSLVGDVVAAREMVDRAPPALTQRAVAELIVRGDPHAAPGAAGRLRRHRHGGPARRAGPGAGGGQLGSLRWNDFTRVTASKPRGDRLMPWPVSFTPVQASSGSR